jgi:ubiquinone biosynthesis protein COQ9
MTDEGGSVKNRLLDAALGHVPFDGWSETTFRAAIADTGLDPGLAKSTCPRGAVDLAIAYHLRCDDAMLERLRSEDLGDLRFRDRIAAAVRLRLEVVDNKEAVRRATTLFSLPVYAADSARMIWGTADKIWNFLGDASDDVNWYTKRATLSGVYGATVLYWLGDNSADHTDTWAFLDRRIDDVMQFEKVKAQLRDNPVLSRLMTGPNWLLGHVKAPRRRPEIDLPGTWTAPRD